MVLDVSRCPLVTERGLATLHKLQSVLLLITKTLNFFMTKTCKITGLITTSNAEFAKNLFPSAEIKALQELD